MATKTKTLTNEQLSKKFLLEEYFYTFIRERQLKGLLSNPTAPDAETIEEWKALSSKLDKKNVDTLNEEFTEYNTRISLIERYLSSVDRNRSLVGYDVKQRTAVVNREKETLF